MNQTAPEKPPADGPSPASRPAAAPLPSLQPGEVITWIKLERPRLALGEIIVGSFALVGVLVVAALAIGLILGQLRSRRTGAHGTSTLGLR